MTGKVIRAMKPAAGKVMGTPSKALKAGMGIELVKKDAHYLHFIRYLLG